MFEIRKELENILSKPSFDTWIKDSIIYFNTVEKCLYASFKTNYQLEFFAVPKQDMLLDIVGQLYGEINKFKIYTHKEMVENEYLNTEKKNQV